jgi:hypothetical protein
LRSIWTFGFQFLRQSLGFCAEGARGSALQATRGEPPKAKPWRTDRNTRCLIRFAYSSDWSRCTTPKAGRSVQGRQARPARAPSASKLDAAAILTSRPQSVRRSQAGAKERFPRIRQKSRGYRYSSRRGADLVLQHAAGLKTAMSMVDLDDAISRTGRQFQRSLRKAR